MVESLLKSIRHCTLCANNLPLKPKPILQGSKHSRILIAGQAPGAITHEKGITFDDKSGERLRSWLGVNSATFYNQKMFAIAPMAFCYPGKGKTGDLPPPVICATTWRKQLIANMPKIELTIILGKYAVDWHLQTKESITTLAQQWQNSLTNNQLVLLHPSPRNNIWLKKNSWFEAEVVPQLQRTVNKILIS